MVDIKINGFWRLFMDKIEKKTNRAGFVAKTVVGIAIGVFLSFFGYEFIMGKLGRSNVAVDPQLVKASAEINKNLPMLVDAETRLNSTEVLPGKKFVYNYTLINYEYTETDSKNIEDFKNTMRPGILNNIKTNSSLQNFRAIGVTMIYRYADKNSIELFTLEFTPNDYN
ncbi:MAG: hypothetical protein LBG90_06030 [Spirochaetaceae bacterium]|jgi:hypothetical protein|nr:hypothetical protein [Spirochaetaceae bacterium]